MTEPSRQHVLERGQPIYQIELLEDDRDTPARASAQSCHVVIVDPHGATVRQQ